LFIFTRTTKYWRQANFIKKCSQLFELIVLVVQGHGAGLGSSLIRSLLAVSYLGGYVGERVYTSIQEARDLGKAKLRFL
jgi:hypothetical protein